MSNNAVLPEPRPPIRVVVGFKVDHQESSPTSVLKGASEELLKFDPSSPRSRLAEALRKAMPFQANAPPLRRLCINTTGARPLSKSRSHADVSVALGSPHTPAISSTSSTPVRIPLVLARCHTCPFELTEIHSGGQPQSTLPSSSRSSRFAPEEEQIAADDLPVRALFGADRKHAGTRQEALEGQPDEDTGAIFALEVPPKVHLQLRLPAAAISRHRRVRSVEAPPRRRTA